MLTIKSIKYNAALNIIYTITNMLFPLITFPYVSRILFAEGMGKVSFFTSVANYASMVGSLGILTYGVRSVAKVRDDKKELSKVSTELFFINTVVTLVVVGLLILSIPFVSKFRSEFILFFINMLIVLTTPIGLDWLYSGLEQYSYITKRTIAFKSISLALVFLLVHDKADYPLYAGITAFSTIGSYACNFINARKFVTLRICRELDLKKHYKPMLLLFASILAVSVYTNLDTIMLGFINGDTAVGLYTVAVKVKWLLLSAVNAISVVLLPRLSFYLSKDNMDEYNRVLKKSVSIIFLIAIPLTLYFITEAKDTILILGGNDYVKATLCMQIIMPILLISGFSNITGNQILIPKGKDSSFMIAVVTGAVINIIFNALLMPKFGCTGAAVSTLLAELVQMSIQFAYAKEQIVNSISSRTLIKAATSTVIACTVTIFIRGNMCFSSVINFIISFVIFFGIYGILLLAFKEENSLEIAHGVLSKVKIKLN